MTTTITLASRVHEFTVKAAVTGFDPVPLRRGGFEIVPHGIAVKYRKIDDGPWEIVAIHVLGYRLLKSGGVSDKVVHGTSYNVGAAPDWVVEFAHVHLPS